MTMWGSQGKGGSGSGSASPTRSLLAVGDSITANGYSSGGNFKYYTAFSPINWALAYMNQRLDLVANVGISGSKAADWKTTLPGYLATYNSRFVSILLGTNDISNDISAAQIIQDLNTCYKTCTDAGRIVLASTILPRGSAGITAAQMKRLYQVNDWIREHSMRSDNILVSDPFLYFQNPATGEPWVNETLATDSNPLHPNPSGSMRVGQIWANDWQGIIPPTRRTLSGINDLIDTTDNPQGSLITNPRLQTLSATSGTGYAGNNPTGYTVQRVAGAGTWTGSAVARSDGVPGNWYRASIASETSASAQYEIRQNKFGPNGGGSNTYTIGDQVYATAELKVTHTGSTNYVKGIYVGMNEYDLDGNLTQVTAALYKTSDTNIYWRAQDFSVTFRTPTITLAGSAGSGTTNQRITAFVDVLFDGTVSNALTVDIGEVAVKKIVP